MVGKPIEYRDKRGKNDDLKLVPPQQEQLSPLFDLTASPQVKKSPPKSVHWHRRPVVVLRGEVFFSEAIGGGLAELGHDRLAVGAVVKVFPVI